MGVNFPKLKVPKVLKSVKYSLAIVNGIFLLTGLSLLLAGIAVLIINTEYEVLITKRFFNIPAFSIATGIIILLTAVLGFYAAISEHFYSVAGYVILLLVVLVFEISLVIAAFALKNDAFSEIRPTMLQSLQSYSSSQATQIVWDDLQKGFECCGVAGWSDYISNQIPVSCCFIDYGTISPFICLPTNSNKLGCATALGDWLSYNAHVLAICALVVTCIQVVLTALSGWLAWRSKFQEVELES